MPAANAVVVFTGLPGTGKSTLADRVATAIAAPSFAGDWLMGALAPHGVLDVHRRRIEGRRRGIPGWHEIDWAHVERMRAEFPPLTAAGVTTLDTAAYTVDDAVAVVLDRGRCGIGGAGPWLSRA